MLVEHGANIFHRDRHLRLPFHHAVRSSTVATVDYLAKVSGDLNVVDQFGDTALHMAAERGHGGTEIICALVDRQCNISIRNNLGLTPLELATHRLGYQMDQRSRRLLEGNT